MVTRKRMTTYQKLLQDIRRQFLSTWSSSAHLEALELVCFGGGMSREEFYRDGSQCVPPETEERIRALAARHLDGDPVAYLIGEWEFYGVTLEVTEDVLTPRSDTEVLAEEAIAWLKGQRSRRTLDLCAGSGCIGLALASQIPDCRVLLGEISEAALRVCRRNIRRTGLGERVSAMALDALQPPPEAIGLFQCVVCNPPYIPRADMEALDRSVKDFEPHLALVGGEDGLDFYRAVTRSWKAVLTDGGRMYFEVGAGQADDVLRLMRDGGFTDVNLLPDTQGIGRVVYGMAAGEG